MGSARGAAFSNIGGREIGMGDSLDLDVLVVPVVEMSVSKREIARIDYTNWRGLRAKRDIWPLSIDFRLSKYHRGPAQWFLLAVDINTGKLRTFAMKDIHSWEPRP